MRKINLEKKDYNLMLEIGDEETVIDNFLNYSSKKSYIQDAINEVAGSEIPIYYDDIWENARDIQEFIEEAIAEGFVDLKNPDLVSIFMCGYEFYYRNLLNGNMGAIIYNMICCELEKLDFECDEDDIDDLIELIELYAKQISVDDKMQDIYRLVEKVVEEF